MKQKVHNVSYLAVTTLNLKDLKSSEVIAFPLGAEICDVSLEVQEAGDAGLTCNLGLLGSEDFFANGIDLSTIGHHSSSIKHTCKDKGAITITPSSVATKGSVKIRVFYFLPSTILAEY
ncbi:hypothetical protein B6S12_07660 [Helicobacter valdiviensis]|uniref:Uncharacterized protein n=1 Tax=Helicobacter valdiviensis TaxID=1458358 RepID=A0A2W6MUY3_9HELI|nr:hypothetical protein [Helicobacter valdiviensis]PZT47729.1 hypothetical protein B6S12_07660 [Helicobacter valdiviensis]